MPSSAVPILELSTNGALDAPWYAVQTRSHFERTVFLELEKKGIDAFLPLRRLMRRWSDRNKLVEEPLFRGYVFVRPEEDAHLQVLRTAGVVRFIGPKSSAPWIVPEPEMNALKRFISEKLRIDPYPYLREGLRVCVKHGPLRGVEGFIVRKSQFCRLVISVEMMMQSVSVEIDESAVEPL